MDQAKIGNFIAAMRKHQNLTQEQLGEKLGVTNKTVSRWETGKYMPDIDKLQELSAILGVSVNELLSGERIEDAESFVKKADENLVAVLSKDSSFGLQDRIAFFKDKWLKEHKVLIAFPCIVLYLVFIVGIYEKMPVLVALVPVSALVIYGYLRNQMMIYVEDRAFRH